MRRSALFACLFALALPAPASANVRAAGFLGQAASHGPDRAGVVDRGVEAPGPAGGATGKPLSPALRAKLSGAATRYRLPTSWCGTPRSTDNKANELNNGVYRYHAIYAIPADAPNRFRQVADTIQSDAFQASALLERAYGRAIRFDMGTDCGPQYLDIATVRLPVSAAQMRAVANTPTGTLDAVMGGINAAGFPTIRPHDTIESASTRNRNFVVWIDGPSPSGACGQATSFEDPSRTPDNLNNLGGKVAVVFPNGEGFCSSNTVRHEIAHNLGALQPAAPHAFDGAHCDDAYEDTMCYSTAPRRSSGERGLYFDYGNDDYWDPPRGSALPWWTANLNRFLCPDAACNVAPGAGTNTNVGTEAVPAEPVDTRSRELRVSLKLKRLSRKRWKATVRARGEGRAVVTIRCRPGRRRAVRTVMTKRTDLPRTIRKRVRCATKPRARALAIEPAG